jgi:hypothetical protein
LENPSRKGKQIRHSAARAASPLNCSSRRQEALTVSRIQMERTHVRFYMVRGKGTLVADNRYGFLNCYGRKSNHVAVPFAVLSLGIVLSWEDFFEQARLWELYRLP